jgi:hypothetical protein
MSFSNQIANYGPYRYIVTGTEVGPFPTIQSAINQAVLDGYSGVNPVAIFVRPGQYVENLILVDGINIDGSQEGIVEIVGIHTAPIAGDFVITNCKLTSGTDVFTTAVPSTCNMTTDQCLFNTTNGVWGANLFSGILSVQNCSDISVANYVVNNISGATVFIKDSIVGAGIFPLAITGACSIINSSIGTGIAANVNATVLVDQGSTILGEVVTAVNAIVDIFNSRIESGIATALLHNSVGLVTLENVVIDSSNVLAIDGTGQIEAGEIVFNDSHGIVGTITYANNSLLKCTSLNAQSQIEVNVGDVIIDNGDFWINGAKGTDGQVVIGSTAAGAEWSTITSSSGTIAFTPGSHTLDMNVTGGGITWNEATAATNMVPDNAYITKISIPGVLGYTLPAVCPQGRILEITGYSVGMWSIAQGAGQTVHLGAVSTTPGAGGSISATSRYDSIRLVCVTANTEFNMLSSVGNLIVV